VFEGGGLHIWYSNCVLERTQVVGNYTENTGPSGSIWHYGTGIYATDSYLVLKNSLIADNYAVDSETSSYSHGTGLVANFGTTVLINTTIAGNQGLPATTGAGFNNGGNPDILPSLIILNSIIAGNTPSNNQISLRYNNSDYEYFAMENSIFESESESWWFDADDGHYDFDPLFADTNYVLSEYSRAIGLGGTSIEDADGNDISAPSVDFLGGLRPNPAGSNPDLGAYEHELASFRRVVYYVDDAIGSDSNDGLSTAAAVKTIAEALNKSANRDTIELAAGTYTGSNNRNLNMGGLTRIIRSTYGAASTIIDCENQGPAFVFNTDDTGKTTHIEVAIIRSCIGTCC
jgi:hypothetical protein